MSNIGSLDNNEVLDANVMAMKDLGNFSLKSGSSSSSWQAKQIFASEQHPIFILGILQRSGTNYLNNLLLLHPDIKAPGIVWEDFLLAHSELLISYVEKTQRRWPSQWAEAIDRTFGSDALLKCIGNGLIDFMEGQYWNDFAKGEYKDRARTPVRLVTATPSVRNLHSFYHIFPNAAPVIIVRDGRALVESGVRSFNWDYEEAMRMWVAGARRIHDFCANPTHRNRFLLVRYEDLCTRMEDEIGRVLEFLGLDANRYDFQAARNLGVVGSSDLVKNEKDLHWKSVNKSANFDPLSRASEWSPNLRSRFQWLAGENMYALGYEMEDVARRPTLNAVVDCLFGLGTKLRGYSPIVSSILKKCRYRLMQVHRKE